MGCDIHTYVEQRHNGAWYITRFHPFMERHYGAFGFLADVRNYSSVPTIAKPRGLPHDLCFMTQWKWNEGKDDWHTPSWLSARELLTFDYWAIVEDRRTTRRLASGVYDGGQTVDSGEGIQMTWAKFLGPWFMRDIAMLRAAVGETSPDDTRVIFWFDN